MDDNVTRIKIADKEYILIGTAHISEESVTQVDEAIRTEMPDNVCIEIGASRYKSLKSNDGWKNLNLGQVIKQGKGFLLLANLVLSSFQKRMGMDLGVKPGQEMIKAIETAEELNIPFSLCDREIHITLQRAWRKAGFIGKNKILATMLSSVFFTEKLSKEEIEKMKGKNELQTLLDELSIYLPSVKSVLIDERDRYLATSIFKADGKKILAVLGAGHIPGVIKLLNQLHEDKIIQDLSDINVVPPKSVVSKVLPWVIPAAIIALIVTGFFIGGKEQGIDMVIRWLIVNGSLSALGCIVVLAHPLTILLAAVAAPVTSLNPLIGVGMFTGVAEYNLRKPKVEDFENLSKDVSTVKGFFKNKVTHILLVFFFSSIGSVIGTFIALPALANLFTK